MNDISEYLKCAKAVIAAIDAQSRMFPASSMTWMSTLKHHTYWQQKSWHMNVISYLLTKYACRNIVVKRKVPKQPTQVYSNNPGEGYFVENWYWIYSTYGSNFVCLSLTRVEKVTIRIFILIEYKFLENLFLGTFLGPFVKFQNNVDTCL